MNYSELIKKLINKASKWTFQSKSPLRSSPRAIHNVLGYRHAHKYTHINDQRRIHNFAIEVKYFVIVIETVME